MNLTAKLNGRWIWFRRRRNAEVSVGDAAVDDVVDQSESQSKKAKFKRMAKEIGIANLPVMLAVKVYQAQPEAPKGKRFRRALLYETLRLGAYLTPAPTWIPVTAALLKMGKHRGYVKKKREVDFGTVSGNQLFGAYQGMSIGYLGKNGLN
ncbi:hypothetical protein HOK51_04720 [Candidatus Woesearchaeota archaeon]|jgi:hypothetical protein|nr:hypothetical protein [Candidatus Woesearchaeota archaeon]MBT6519128.1 hypothetical protein [Candidatus Woesearchaeota archaeon]MBT7367761.1 hypothetical protein [Candidatus Woesearchaeota archaeon]